MEKQSNPTHMFYFLNCNPLIWLWLHTVQHMNMKFMDVCVQYVVCMCLEHVSSQNESDARKCTVTRRFEPLLCVRTVDAEWA